MLGVDELVRGCKSGDRVAQKEFYIEHYNLVYQVTVRYSSSCDEAKDRMHDIFLKIFDRIDNFKGDTHDGLGGWVNRVSINHCIDNNRKFKHEFTHDSEDFMSKLQFGRIDEQYEEDCEYSLKEILSAIQQLSPRYKTIFNMYVMDGFSHDEIGEVLGLNPGTSKSNLFKARHKLQKILTKNKVAS